MNLISIKQQFLCEIIKYMGRGGFCKVLQDCATTSFKCYIAFLIITIFKNHAFNLNSNTTISGSRLVGYPSCIFLATQTGQNTAAFPCARMFHFLSELWFSMAVSGLPSLHSGCNFGCFKFYEECIIIACFKSVKNIFLNCFVVRAIFIASPTRKVRNKEARKTDSSLKYKINN